MSLRVEHGTKASEPPRSDQLEVSVFGPGVGEALVVHAGDGVWLTVDSCTRAGSSRPIALEYLLSLGVSLEQIQLIVATHWHSDHIGGLGSLVEAAESAEFACSSALQTHEYLQFLKATETVQGSAIEPASSEMARALTCVARRRPSRGGASPVLWSGADQRLLLTRDAEVWAVAPSPGTQSRAKLAFAKLMPKEGQPILRPVATTGNEFAVVLMVRAGDRWLLLGSDLEHNSKDPGRGWKAVVASKRRPQDRSGFFKVPHHGSAGADHPPVWTEMLAAHPVAVLTPNSSSGLPRSRDLERLASRTPHVFCTATARGGKPCRLSPSVERTMREVTGGRRRAAKSEMGHVRLRLPLRGPEQAVVELFGPAFQA